MSIIRIDTAKPCGAMKPMHAVNNGPAGSKVRKGMNNYDLFREARIPYARNHDASFYMGYGGEFTVDVHRIFKNFDADENDPASYDFEMTDVYMKDVESVGAKTFYRLGSRIEHEKKWGTFPPKDFAKWARVCEHIIRHYDEGWADGYAMGIEYWEIWNEPDCRNRDGSNPCWQGTDEQFTDLFITTVRHLKACFPTLKIGGPAFCSAWNDRFNKLIFDALKDAGLTLDFFSFHGYARDPHSYAESGDHAYELLKKYGCEGKTELILNEWNYIRGWVGEDWIYSLRSEKGLKGSSFIAGTMCTGQKSKLDMMMYYDARPCGMNGMFDTDFLTPLKGYYPFKAFADLYDRKTELASESDERNLYCAAAGDDKEIDLLASYYDDDDTLPAKQVEVHFENLGGAPVQADIYLLDADHDLTLVRSEKIAADEYTAYLDMKLFTTVEIRLKKL